MTALETLHAQLLSCNAEPLLRELFADDDRYARTAAGSILEVASMVGAPTAVVLVRASSGVVVGFEVDSGSRIVVKVHRAHAADRLAGVLRAQRQLRTAGLPVAEPLLDRPVPVGSGWATVETWHAQGATVDVRPAALRRAVAQSLHDVVTALDVTAYDDLGPSWSGPYPPPHSPIFDFAATSAGAEWIDARNHQSIVEKARLTTAGVGQPVVAHTDLRPENLLISLTPRRAVTAIYDLDSLVTDAEPWLVGGVARAFSTNWSMADPMIPTVDEIFGFVRDYEDARGVRFTDDERVLARAGVQNALAYSARCEHALFPDGSTAPWGPGWRNLLRHWS